MFFASLEFNRIFRILLTFNATSLLIIVFLVQKGYDFAYFFPGVEYLHQFPKFLSYALYMAAPIALTGLSLLLGKLLGKDEFKTGQVACIEHANNSFLPSYLGYFFVALSIGSWETLFFVFGVLFVFKGTSKNCRFQPVSDASCSQPADLPIFCAIPSLFRVFCAPFLTHWPPAGAPRSLMACSCRTHPPRHQGTSPGA